MVDLTRDVDEYFAELEAIEEILIGGKTEAQITEVIVLLEAVVEAPARKAAMARLLERLEQMHHENQASRKSA